MERLTNKREADAQREGYERRLANGYQRSIPVERFLRLAAYEDSELEPEEVSALIKDWLRLCTTIRECGGIDRLRVLADADKGGRLVVHGQWMHEETEGGFHIWRCSRCGRGMNDNPEGIDSYCYHCGAKMDGGDNDAAD